MKNQNISRAPGKGDDGMPGDPAPRRILIVDDDSMILDILSGFLCRFDVKVARADNGHAAYELFEQQPFDLVITDLQMPVMGGLALMAKIKTLSDQTPVVVITGLVAEEVEQMDGMDASAAVLYKPFKLDLLERTLRHIFGTIQEKDRPDGRPCFDTAEGRT